jgi:three-Cys-motif partner protein
MRSDKFFESAQTWSKRKHRLLGKYLVPFSSKVGSLSSEIYCVDAFAGQGRYKDGYEGSPLLMARIADECIRWTNPVTLRLINIESNPRNFATLSESTKEWTQRGIVMNERGRFGAVIPMVLSVVGDTPALFFIDPYGPSPVHFEYLRPLLKRRQSITELIINFNVSGLRRLADGLRADAKTEVGRKACETIVRNVTRILGRDRWRQFFATDHYSAAEREKFLLDDYMDSFSQFGYHVAAYSIRAALRSAAKYHLIYCTRHRDGIALMNRFVRAEEDELLRESLEQRGQAWIFDPVDEEIRVRRRELRMLVLELSQNKERMTRREIKDRFIFERFGDFSEPDYNAVVKELMEAGAVRAYDGRTRINDDIPLLYVRPDTPVLV